MSNMYKVTRQATYSGYKEDDPIVLDGNHPRG